MVNSPVPGLWLPVFTAHFCHELAAWSSENHFNLYVPQYSLWPRHVKSWLIGKDSDAGRDCGQEEKGTTEDEMAGWHHWLDGRESEWTPGVGDGQGGLACCDSWGRKELDMTERLIWSELICRPGYWKLWVHQKPQCEPQNGHCLYRSRSHLSHQQMPASDFHCLHF